MSKSAHDKNCLHCSHRVLMWRGEVQVKDYPCPTDGHGKLITPRVVFARMPKTWVCPERKA